MKTHRANRLQRQRGVAVITALLLTTLAITIVASLFWQQQVQVRSIENQRLQLQTKWILRGALDWARLILREDKKFSSVDHTGEPWAVPLAETRLDEYVEKNSTSADTTDAALSGRIVDAQARFNLTNLCANAVIDPEQVAVFERLLALLRLNPALASATAEVMAAAQQRTAASATGSAGADAGAAAPLGLTHQEDLLAVPGFTPEIVDSLKEYVVVLPRLTSINVNTAPAEVLAARIETLSIDASTTLVANRETAYFRNLGDFEQRLPQGSLPSGTRSALDVSTSYFIVHGNVRLDRASQEMRSLIERNGNSTKVIWIRNN